MTSPVSTHRRNVCKLALTKIKCNKTAILFCPRRRIFHDDGIRISVRVNLSHEETATPAATGWNEKIMAKPKLTNQTTKRYKKKLR